jgi:nitrate reductase gamma subunit
MTILQLIIYASALVFVLGFARKILKYFTMPMHVRWELYPVPHEGKPYGGSSFEEVDQWEKPRHKNYFAQYSFMIPEILFIRALKEDNAPLWYCSFPFHFGLYLAIGGLAFLVIGAILQIFGLTPEASGLAWLVQALTVILGVIGFVLGAIGAVALFFKRLADSELRDVSAPIDYFNLIWLAAMFITGFVVWLTDPVFAVAKNYLISLITFKPAPELPTMHVINLLIFAGFWAYFPFTHMTHMVSKYFMWDKVKWDDNPNVGDPGMDAKIKKYLAYPVSWAAPHIGAEGGKKTWADVATTNPWAQEDAK